MSKSFFITFFIIIYCYTGKWTKHQFPKSVQVCVIDVWRPGKTGLGRVGTFYEAVPDHSETKLCDFSHSTLSWIFVAALGSFNSDNLKTGAKSYAIFTQTFPFFLSCLFVVIFFKLKVIREKNIKPCTWYIRQHLLHLLNAGRIATITLLLTSKDRKINKQKSRKINQVSGSLLYRRQAEILTYKDTDGHRCLLGQMHCLNGSWSISHWISNASRKCFCNKIAVCASDRKKYRQSTYTRIQWNICAVYKDLMQLRLLNINSSYRMFF